MVMPWPTTKYMTTAIRMSRSWTPSPQNHTMPNANARKGTATMNAVIACSAATRHAFRCSGIPIRHWVGRDEGGGKSG